MDPSKHRNDAKNLMLLNNVKTFFSNVRFSASFRRLEESTPEKIQVLPGNVLGLNLTQP